MTIELLDPADADNFRMTKDYGRWYIDPLPGCDIAPATDAQWPSCSAVKKASEKDWSFLVAPRLAALEPDEYRRLATIDRTQRLDALKSHEKYAQNIAFGRGSIIHLWKEDLLAGRTPRQISDSWLRANKYPHAALEAAAEYLPAIRDFFDVYQPEPVVVEYVTIHRTLNGHGYGATPDALVRIEGEVVAVDWKTRSDGSNHAAYPEEAAQIACGARAQYMIVRDGGEARRARIPDVSGGYVVSIKTDGARLYPIDIVEAWDHWRSLHMWWVARQSEKDSIGRVLPARRKNKIEPGDQPVSHSAPPSPATTPTMRHDSAPLARTLTLAKERMANDAERAAARDGEPTCCQMSQGACGCKPDEGAPVSEADFDVLKKAYDGLPPAATEWFKHIVVEATEAGVDFRAQLTKTVRRYEIYRGLIRLGAHGWLDDAQARGFVEEVTGDDAVNFANVTLGHAIGSMNAAEAAAFSKLIDGNVGG